MAASTHYIRSIHSSFSAHSPSSAAWASATASAQYHLNHHNSLTHTHTHTPNPNTTPSPIHPQHPLPRQHHSNQLGYAPQGFTHTPSISTHNTHMYTHHLRDLTHSPSAPPQRSSGAQGPTPPPGMAMTQQGQYIPGPQLRLGGRAKTPLPSRTPPSPPPTSRRRSASIRMPPSYKFDPFGDEPSMPAGFTSSGGGGGGGSVSAMPLTSSSQANRALSSPLVVPETFCTAEPEMEADISSAAPMPNQPYTIHIPAAAPNDIKLYTPSPAPRLSARAPSFTPALHPTSPPAAAATPKPYSRTSQSYPAPNLSKIVAGILLNRVHAAKPMRRRAGPGATERQYVKSCLSSVVSVEA